MKLTQTNNQIDIQMGAGSQLLTGAIFLVIGIAAIIFGLHLPNNAHGQTTTSNDGTTTTTSAHAGPIVMGIGGVAIIAGIAVIALSSTRRTTLVKDGDTTLSVHRLLGGGTQSQSFATASIRSIRLNSFSTNNGANGSSGNRRSNLSVVLADNTIVDIASKGSGGFSVNGMNIANIFNKPPLTNEADQLSQFLGIPLESTDLSSLPGMINTVRNAWGGSDNDPQAASQRIGEAFIHGQPPQQPVTPVAPQPVTSQPTAITLLAQPPTAAPLSQVEPVIQMPQVSLATASTQPVQPQTQALAQNVPMQNAQSAGSIDTYQAPSSTPSA